MACLKDWVVIAVDPCLAIAVLQAISPSAERLNAQPTAIAASNSPSISHPRSRRKAPTQHQPRSCEGDCATHFPAAAYGQCTSLEDFPCCYSLTELLRAHRRCASRQHSALHLAHALARIKALPRDLIDENSHAGVDCMVSAAQLWMNSNEPSLARRRHHPWQR